MSSAAPTIPAECEACEGTGWVATSYTAGGDDWNAGTREVRGPDEQCTECGGSGLVGVDGWEVE
jgi:hypothetical protein